MKKVNLTIELESNEEIQRFESWIKDVGVNVIDLTILTDTKELYESDEHFKDITKQYYAIKRIRNNYINLNNFK